MWKSIICRHGNVEWLDSHRCNCANCGKYGHWFEEGYVIWTRASGRPLEADDAEVHEFDLEPALAGVGTGGSTTWAKRAG
jgi:hypothetical protein